MAVDWHIVARNVALRHHINSDVFLRMIAQESGFNPKAVSPAGAVGIAQIMPATAAGWGVNPRNPRASLNAAAKALSGYLHSYRGDWRLALAAYNAGPGAVAQYHGVPPYSETRNYVRNILVGLPRFNHPNQFVPDKARKAMAKPVHQPSVPSSQLTALLQMLGSQGAVKVSPKQNLAQLQATSSPGASGVANFTPNVTTPGGKTTGELYTDLGALRRRLLTA